jgi:hypothetical protein
LRLASAHCLPEPRETPDFFEKRHRFLTIALSRFALFPWHFLLMSVLPSSFLPIFLVSQWAIVASSVCFIPRSFLRIMKGKTANHNEAPKKTIAQERLSVLAVEESLRNALIKITAVKRLPTV